MIGVKQMSNWNDSMKLTYDRYVFELMRGRLDLAWDAAKQFNELIDLMQQNEMKLSLAYESRDDLTIQTLENK